MMERRRCRRIVPPQKLQVQVKYKEEAMVVNLTPYGTLLKTATPLVPQSRHKLSFAIDGDELNVQGVVRRCRLVREKTEQGSTFFAGMEFVHLEKNQQESLEDAVVDYSLTEMACSTSPRDDHW